MEGRIWFEGNPWPSGHPIKSAELFIELSEGEDQSWPPERGAYLGLNIKSHDYYSEMTKDEREKAYKEEAVILDNNESIADWNSYIVWKNYHRCRIESSNAQIGTSSQKLDLRNFERCTMAFETGRKSVADQENALNAFTCYILGHDSVSDHEIKFSTCNSNTGSVDIAWTGAVALSYLGELDFDYRFRAELKNVPFLGMKGPRYQELRETSRSFFGLFRKSDYYDLRQDKEEVARERALRNLAETSIIFDQSQFQFQARDRCDWLVPLDIPTSTP